MPEVPPEKTAKLRFMTINDVYLPQRFAQFKTICDDVDKNGSKVDCTKRMLCGDFLGASPYAIHHQGESVIDLMNSVEMDYSVIGNHEFDFGSLNLISQLTKSKFLNFGSNIILNENLVHSDLGCFTPGSIMPGVTKYHTFEVTSSSSSSSEEDVTVKVGILGVCTDATPKLSHPTNLVKFDDPVKEAIGMAKFLRKGEKCDVVIALTHVSIAQDKLIAEKADIDFILGGHEHTPYLMNHRGTMILKCGQDADHVGVIDFVIKKMADDDETGLVSHSLQLISTYGVTPDAGIQKVIQKWPLPAKAEGADEPICKISNEGAALSSLTRHLREHETSFGCLVADAMLWSYREFDPDAGLINGGFVRGNNKYMPGTYVTPDILENETPFDRCPTFIRMTGAQLRLGLEQMISKEPPMASFPHVSKGIRIEYNLDRPSLCRISSVQIRGEEVVPDKEYKIVCSDFYWENKGDGVDAFFDKPVLGQHNILIRHLLKEFLIESKEICGTNPGRVVIVPKDQIANTVSKSNASAVSLDALTQNTPEKVIV